MNMQHSRDDRFLNCKKLCWHARVVWIMSHMLNVKPYKSLPKILNVSFVDVVVLSLLWPLMTFWFFLWSDVLHFSFSWKLKDVVLKLCCMGRNRRRQIAKGCFWLEIALALEDSDLATSAASLIPSLYFWLPATESAWPQSLNHYTWMTSIALCFFRTNTLSKLVACTSLLRQLGE